MWLGPCANKKVKPLGLKWVKGPTRFLGIYLSYDKNGNNVHNFGRKMLKLQLKLDIWRTRDLALFGRVLIVKSLGISQLVYSISKVEVPDYIVSTLKPKLFGFLWKNKKDKIKRVGLYQNYERGGLSMTDVDSMIKELRLAWIPRLLRGGHQNWKSVPNYFFDKYGGLQFILNCNYDVKYFEKLPIAHNSIVFRDTYLQCPVFQRVVYQFAYLQQLGCDWLTNLALGILDPLRPFQLLSIKLRMCEVTRGAIKFSAPQNQVHH